jgi:MFS family permease
MRTNRPGATRGTASRTTVGSATPPGPVAPQRPVDPVPFHRSTHPGDSARGRRFASCARGLTLAAAALIAAGGYVHFCLYRRGYRSIPSIGPAFLLQFTFSAIVATALVLARGWLHTGRRRVAMAQVARGAGVAFALGTLVALAIAHTKGGLFGWREFGIQPAPQTAITIIVEWEAAVFLVLAMVCGRVAASRSRPNDQDRAHASLAPPDAPPSPAEGRSEVTTPRGGSMPSHLHATFNADRLPSGVRVRVWCPVTRRWLPGFQVVAATPRGYVVRRLSNRVVLRRMFDESDLRVDPIPSPPGWTSGDAA